MLDASDPNPEYMRELLWRARKALIEQPMTLSNAKHLIFGTDELIHVLGDEGFKLKGRKEAVEHFQAIYDSHRIVMRKTLPAEDGTYYWSPGRDDTPVLGSVSGGECAFLFDFTADISVLGGYWAKVEQDHFEFDGGDGND